MDCEFKLLEEPSKHVLSVRKRTSVGNLPEEMGRAYGAIIQYLSEIGESTSEAAFAAYYNMDMENLDVEMGFPVSKPLAGKGEIIQSSIPAGKWVTYLHKGPYKDMEQAYNNMMHWIEENGYEPTGVSYEFYYNSPMEVPESELLTKIAFPVK